MSKEIGLFNSNEKSVYARISGKASHQKNDGNEISNNSDKSLYACNICLKIFIREDSYLLHIKLHERELELARFECAVCENKSTSLERYKKHMEQHTGEQLFTFPRVRKIIENNEKNAKRIKIEEMENVQYQFDCNICKEKFDGSEERKEHMKKHSNKHPFECVICNKRYSTDRNLQLHIRIHTDHRPYKCDVCCNTFHYKSEFKSHACLTNWTALGMN